MQCYLMKNGHIADVEPLPANLSDQEAVEHCHSAFLRRQASFDDFEVWQLARKVYQHSLNREAEDNKDPPTGEDTPKL